METNNPFISEIEKKHIFDELQKFNMTMVSKGTTVKTLDGRNLIVVDIKAHDFPKDHRLHGVSFDVSLFGAGTGLFFVTGECLICREEDKHRLDIVGFSQKDVDKEE